MSAEDIAADHIVDAAACAGVVAAAHRLDAALALQKGNNDDGNEINHLAMLIESLEEELDLKNHRKDANKPGPGGATPLLVACVQGSAADARVLLQVRVSLSLYFSVSVFGCYLCLRLCL